MSSFVKFGMQDSNLWKAKSNEKFDDLGNASEFVKFAVKDSENSHMRGQGHLWGGVGNQVEGVMSIVKEANKAGKPEASKGQGGKTTPGAAAENEVKNEKVNKFFAHPKSGPVTETESEFVRFAIKDSENSHLKTVVNFGQDNC